MVVLISCHPSIRFHRSSPLRMPERPVGWLSSHLCGSGPVARSGNVEFRYEGSGVVWEMGEEGGAV